MSALPTACRVGMCLVAWFVVVWLFVGGDEADFRSKDCDGGGGLRTGQGVGEVGAASRRVGDGRIPRRRQRDDAPR